MGPRVYNLFPTLAGPLSAWPRHFERIAAMGFDWVYINPIYATGGSGSLYAVADYYRLNPILRGESSRDDDVEIRAMIDAARRRGLAVMFDLVVNHTANDSPLVGAHADWFVRDAAGALHAPSAIDHATGETTVWGDLAEIDFSARPERVEIVAYFAAVVRHFIGLGVRGFRCDAAYQIPGEVWSALIAAAREREPSAVFAAETLGARLEDIAQLEPAGFDFFFNSSKWWDFRSSWLLEQYERFRHIAPSIAFPESHDTPRLAADLAGRDDATIQAEYRFRYLFAAFFSSGVMMPMGFEFGFARKLDVVTTRPGDWEAARFDLQPFIADVNAMKAALPALNEEGAERVAPIGCDAIALLRSAGSSGDVALAVLNPSNDATARVESSVLARALAGTPRDLTPHVVTKHQSGDVAVDLQPWEMRVFAREETPGSPPGSVTPPPQRVRAVTIERVTPQLDSGRFPVKRIVGETVVVEADVFREGHAAIAARLLYQAAGAIEWSETDFTFFDNDRYRGSFPLARVGRYAYTIEAWPEAFASWQHDSRKKRAAGQTLGNELPEGRALLGAALERAGADDAAALRTIVRDFDALANEETRADVLLDEALAALVARAPDRSQGTRYAPELALEVDREAARFSAWYELFPRSLGTAPGRHGTFADAQRRLPEIAAMGFDIVYLPPIHPIGHAYRKGPNNTLAVGPDDPGSPWAIGNSGGGHTAIEPQLGTLEDFERFVTAAHDNGLEVALDYALQCSPDHPYVREHPEWFALRSDGTIEYAENPPKKYQDIVNFRWYGAAAPALYAELRDVVEFWIGRGIRVFRVDNPHTKPFAFWEWMIADVRSRHPETIFLAEAFTRPKVMARLAKSGFSQSYTYFTWRNTKGELTAYMTELARADAAEYFRPNFWPNTPDILPSILQTGGRAAFRIRLALAATLASSYGIYSGFELCENAALPGREEYADSEKYQLRQRDYAATDSLGPEIARINTIRRENAALHHFRNVTFYRADDDAVIFFGKRTGDNVVLVAINLDPFAARDVLLWLPTGEMGIADDESYVLEELLGATRHLWRGSAHRWRLDPQSNPAAIFRIDAAAR